MYRQPAARPKNRLPLLDRVAVKTPCKASWTEMEGDDRARFCFACRKDVYDVSAMSEDEAEAFLALHLDDQDGCVKLYRRPDGRILTADCPQGARTRHTRRVAAAAVAVACATLAVVSVAGDLRVPAAHRLPPSTARFEVPRRPAPPPGMMSEADQRAAFANTYSREAALQEARAFAWDVDRSRVEGDFLSVPATPWGREDNAGRADVRDAPSFAVGEGLPRGMILRIVRQNYGRFRVAYERGLKSKPALAGRVVVRFTIGVDGSVVTAADGGSTLPDPSVVAEIVRSFLGLAFPQPDKGPMTVTLPLDLVPPAARAVR